MSVIGPRPGLWNQDILTAERDKYNANDVKPGLTGWAQINGRDELEIPDKAKLDGEYVSKMGLMMDIKCFLGSVGVFAHDDSVVEGGTGELHNEKYPKKAKVHEDLDFTEEKRVLIFGEGSYIGESFKAYLTKFDNYKIESIDARDDSWKKMNFSRYDVVYDVAGIAHIKERKENKHLYYEVNCNLAVEVAEKAKNEGVKQFIYLSSMSVYGKTMGVIDATTVINPINAYGKSKAKAEERLWELKDNNFIVSIVRPPMVYGRNCKGNYQTLRKFAIKLGAFPDYDNERSMLYIDNLSSTVRGIIHNGESGIYFPQNLDYIKTSLKMFDVAPPKIDKYFCFRSMICHQATVYKGELMKKRGYNTEYKIAADRERLMYAVIEEKCSCKFIPVNIALFQGGGLSDTEKGRKTIQEEDKRLVQQYFTKVEMIKYNLKYMCTFPHIRKLLIKNIYIYRIYKHVVGKIYGTS